MRWLIQSLQSGHAEVRAGHNTLTINHKNIPSLYLIWVWVLIMSIKYGYTINPISWATATPNGETWFEIRVFQHSKQIVQSKTEHKCTHRPGSIPTGISNSKSHTWIHAGFSHWVTQSHESKTRGFSSTCGSTGTWKYLRVLRILNRNKVLNFKYKYMWHKIILRHGVTPWWLNQPHTSYHQSTLISHSHSHPTWKTL